MVMRTAGRIVKEVIDSFAKDECATMAASISYYAVFSLPPLLWILVRAAGAIFGSAQAEQRLVNEASRMIGPTAAEQVQVMLRAAAVHTSGRGLALVIGIGALLFSATGVFTQLQTALNRAWNVRPERSIIQDFLGKRVASMGMVLTASFLLMVSLAVSALLTALGESLPSSTPTTLLSAFELTSSLLIFTVMFAAILRWMPDAEIAWSDVWVGAAATTVLFTGGKYLVAFYLGRSDGAAMFGTAGALAVIMLWVYFASLVLLLGAEFTQVWAVQHGRHIQPEHGAIKVTKQEIVESTVESP